MHLEGLMVEDRKGDTVLYAGDLNVRITDWFFLKKNVELKFIGIENAIIKLQRTDSVWQHQFLADYFSSPSSGSKKGGIELNLKKINLKQVIISQRDAWLGKDMIVKLGELSLDADKINFSKKLIDANTLLVTDPEVALYNYPRLKPRVEKTLAEEEEPDSVIQWNPAGWVVHLNSLKISNGIFRNEKQSSEPVLTSFDGRHIEFNTINADISDINFLSDTITARLKLQTKERSGFVVKNLLADFKATPQSMVFDDLDIETNNSTIKDYFMMSYDDFSDMDDFIHKVRMSGNFVETEIDSDDIAYFAPGLRTWKKKIIFEGAARGTVDDLVGRDLIVEAGNNTTIMGDISLTGLPNIEQTFIDLRAEDFKTTYNDAVTFLPVIRNVTTPDLKKIRDLHFQGSFTGFIRDFVTFGTIRTNLGVVKSDLNMKLPRNGQPVYSGNISTTDFRLGEFINEPLVGSISLDGVVKGTGFTEKTRNANLDGKVHFIDYNNYRYTDITVNGRLNKLLFDGVASINDPNVELTLNGLFDLNPESSAFDVLVNVKKADLQKINIADEDLSIKGNFKLNFTGSNIDEFVGRARVTDASITRGEQRLPFDSLIITSQIVGDQKRLTVLSNEFEGSITGDYKIRELPDAFTLFLNKYYPSYIKPPLPYPGQQSFDFDVTTRNVDEYIRLIDENLKGFDYGHVSGHLDIANNLLELDAQFPNFSYKQYVFSDAEIKGTGDLEKLQLTGRAGNTIINDSIYLPQTTFSIVASNDISKINLNTTANQPVNNANINAVVQTFPDGLTIKFDTTTFSLNGKPWIIDKDGMLDFRKDAVAQGQLVLRSGEQEITMKTEPSPKGNWNDLNITLKKVNLGDFAPLVLPKNRLEGIASGTVKVEDPYKKFDLTSDIQAEQLVLDTDSLGNVIAHIEYNNTTGLLTAAGKNLDPEHKLEFDIAVNVKDKEKAKDNRIAIRTENYPLNIIERFLGDLFTDVQGYVTGPIDITGDFYELNITSNVKLREGGLKVKFTQCFYKIQDTEIQLKPNEINLNGIILTDPVTGNPIYLTGGIQHRSFKNMFFDVTASTRKPFTTDPSENKSVLLLNTTAKDNPQFYGKATGTGLFSLTGPESDLFMQIDAIASETDSSFITIPPSSNKESGIADFLVERKYGREMADLGLQRGGSNIVYNIDLVVNPAVNVRVVLDELTADEIKGKADGTLSISSGTSEPLSIRGRLDIVEGDYLFTFQSFFKKPFVLRPGSDNYIEWTDDPYEARIHFDAVYTADNVSFAPLVNALNLDPSLNRYREDVYVVATLSGRLFSPDFEFSLEFPPNSRAKNDPSLAFNIQQIEKNPNEINRQITYLIVFNSFAPLESGSSTTPTGSFSSAAVSEFYRTISGLIFNEINKELNKAFSKIFKTDNVSINFSGSVYNRNLLDQPNKNTYNINQGNFNLTVPVSFFKDRFIITLGGGLDVPLQSQSTPQNVQFLPDVTAEWLINQSGTVRATFFYRQDLDFITSGAVNSNRNKRSGASISYRKEVDTFWDLFKSRKKRQQQQQPVSLESDSN